MRLIKQNVELLQLKYNLDSIYRHIELCARTCYKSEGKITDTSAKGFVDMLIRNQHFAMLEHGTVYLNIPASKYEHDYLNNPYSKVDDQFNRDTRGFCVTTNLRVLHENEWLDDLQFLCTPTEDHEKRFTVRITTDRAVAQQITRHRIFSYAMTSQRYVNYAKQDNIDFIEPSWYEDTWASSKEAFEKMLRQAEQNYFLMVKMGFQPQQARAVLPNATKTELIMTGFASDWERFLEIRLLERTGKVHPDMKKIAYKIFQVLPIEGNVI